MSKKFKICSRLQIEGRDKPIWVDTGMTLTQRDDGKMTIFDSRTLQNYYVFEKEDKYKPQQVAEQAHGVQSSKPDFDDIPF